MESRESKVGELLDRLILSINKNATTEFKDQCHQFAKMTLARNPMPLNQSAEQLKDQIVEKVAKNNNQRSVLHCQQCADQFLKSRVVSRKAQILKMLSRLSENVTPQNQNFSNLFKESAHNRTTTSETINTSHIMQVSSTQPKEQRRKGMNPQYIKNVRNKGSFQDGISESFIINQLAFVVNNAKSTYIQEQSGHFQLKNNIKVSETVRKMVSQVADLGWIHKKINTHFNEGGEIRKALGMAVKMEMNQFYRWIGIMENLAKEDNLSLRRLYHWAYEPLEILKWLTTILEAVQPFYGCQIISIVNSYIPHGSQVVNSLINRLLGQLLQPLFQYIYHWVYKGELLDTYHEFFISENKKVSESEEWEQKFKLISEFIPGIFDKQSSYMLLNTGKTIYFLRKRCNFNYSIQTQFIDTNKILNSKLQQTDHILKKVFGNWLREVYEQTNQILVKVLFNNFSLRQHLLSMKYFYLLGKGDFIQMLFDNLKEQLLKPKSQIYQHTLDGYISQAIQKCFTSQRKQKNFYSQKMIKSSEISKFYRTDVLDRLLAKKSDFSKGSDCFNFQYSIERLQPMQPLLSPEIMLNYQKIFHFLWKIKGEDERLKGLWINQSKRQLNRDETTEEIQRVFLHCYSLRSYMDHCINNIFGYLMVTIQGRWKIFEEQLETAKNYDEIIKIHKEFQKEIIMITLNSPKYKNINSSLSNIFDIIKRFEQVYRNLQQNYDLYYQEKKTYNGRLRMIEEGIQLENLEIPQFKYGSIIKDIKQLRNNYETTFKYFYNSLKKQSESEPGLTALCTRLTFNDFYG